MAVKVEKRWSKTNTEKAKSKVKRCTLCGVVFFSQSKRRKFCCPHHAKVWAEYQCLLRKREARRLRDFEFGLLERLEKFIQKERERIAKEEIERASRIGLKLDAKQRQVEVNEASKDESPLGFPQQAHDRVGGDLL